MLEKLRQLAIDASKNSYSPYSKAKVGASVLMSDGKYFNGCNIENSSFGGTVCAERVAIWKAISEGSSKIQHLYVYTKDGWPPCGLCLQVISEFAFEETQITIGSYDQENITTENFKKFMPHAFTPDHLDKK